MILKSLLVFIVYTGLSSLGGLEAGELIRVEVVGAERNEEKVLPTPFLLEQLSLAKDRDLMKTRYGLAFSNYWQPLSSTRVITHGVHTISRKPTNSRGTVDISLGGEDLFARYDVNFRQAFMTKNKVFKLSSLVLETQDQAAEYVHPQEERVPSKLEFFRLDTYLPKDIWHRVPSDVEDYKPYLEEHLLEFEEGESYNSAYVYSRCIEFKSDLERPILEAEECPQYPLSYSKLNIPLIYGAYLVRVTYPNGDEETHEIDLPRATQRVLSLR